MYLVSNNTPATQCQCSVFTDEYTTLLHRVISGTTVIFCNSLTSFREALHGNYRDLCVSMITAYLY